jgi:hypothetical protein
MSDPTHTTGFFDLALELRRMVYDYVLPEDRIVSFPTTHQAEKDMFTFCETHNLIRKEMEAWMYEKCICYLHIIPDKEDRCPPLGIEFHRFQTIRIKIQQPLKDHGEISMEGVEQAIALLRYGSPTLLPTVSVRCEESNMYRDPFWTQSVPSGSTFRRSIQEEGFAASNMDCFHWFSSHDGGYVSENIEAIDMLLRGSDTWLRVSPDSFGPIVVEILDHFLDLPACRRFSVRPLGGISYRGVWKQHDPQRRVFDAGYMTDILDAIRLWMNGKRDGIDLPKEANDWFESRLEQLAYSRKDGKLYCDGYHPQSGE